MKVYLKGSKRGCPKSKGGKKPYKAGWYGCNILDVEDTHITAKLVDGNVIRKATSRFRSNKGKAK